MAKKWRSMIARTLGGKKPEREVRPLSDRTWEVLDIDVDSRGRWAIVSFKEHDLRPQHMADAVAAEFKSLLDHLAVDRVVIDFRGVEHLLSSEIGAVLHFVENARKADVLVAFCCLEPEVDKAFELFDIDRIVDIFDSRRDAVALMDKPEKPWYWPFG